jgi:lipoprotein-anchoring transpeptidase ErfK/SrfK
MMMIELYLALRVLCSGTDCIPVAIGPDTYRAAGKTYELTEWSVPMSDRKRYGDTWYQIGSDEEWGIHGYPHFGKWMVSHGCIRVGDFAKVKSWKPTTLRIVK